MDILREYFGIGGYQRTPEGAYSWQHLTFVGALMALMVGLAVWLGLRNRHRDNRDKNRVLCWAAILIDGLELIKIGIACWSQEQSGYPWYHGVLYNLPLFLCSIQLITIPLAAFSAGRLKEAALDFVSVFGLLGAVLGTVGAAQNYSNYPVLGFDNMVSGFTHCISGFAALYILIAGMASMQRKNTPITFAILLTFAGGAFVANAGLDYNYMFLRRGDGTPYDILYNLVEGDPVWYPVGVMAVCVGYILLFYAGYYLATKSKKDKEPVTV